jgi:pimeloyl-ACP methyl ester carboxylesterase
VLDLFNQLVGPPSRTIAWGHSLGGMVTAGLIQRYPDRFDAGGGLQVVNIADPDANLVAGRGGLDIAQATPQGRARLALVHAFANGPGWFIKGGP